MTTQESIQPDPNGTALAPTSTYTCEARLLQQKDGLFLKVSDIVPSSRRDSFMKLASLVLSVGLARSAAHIMTERAEATVAGEERDERLDLFDFYDVNDFQRCGGGGR